MIIDISKSYILGVPEAMPQADIVFGCFHIAKQLNEAIDEIRRQEQWQYNDIEGLAISVASKKCIPDWQSV